MADYYCEAKISNEDEWLEYASEIIKNRSSKSNEQLLEEISTFDFKFEFISVLHK